MSSANDPAAIKWSDGPSRYATVCMTVRVILGLVLLAAAALKAHKLWLRPIPDSGLLDSRALGIALVEVELVIGLLLVFGGRTLARPAWFAALVFFGIALQVAFLQAVRGNGQCGCFGVIEVNPWTAVFIDMAALSALLASFPAAVGVRSLKRRAAIVGSLAVLLGGTSAFLLASRQASELAGDQPVSGNVIVVSPELWMGQRLPLLTHLDTAAKLETGEWIVVLYRQSCRKCDEVISQHVSRLQSRDQSEPRLALIEVPPFGNGRQGYAEGDAVSYGRLSADREWVVTTPVVMHLRDGVVVRSSTSNRTFPNYAELRRKQFHRYVACGPMSLLAVFDHLKLSLSSRDREEIIASAGSRGIDMLRLKKLAERHGAHALGVEASVSELRRIGLPAIVHFPETTFVAALDYSPDGIRVKSPSGLTTYRSDDNFAQRFGNPGRALLISSNPISVEELSIRDMASNSAVELSPSVLSVGRIHALQWRSEVLLKNVSSRPLKITEIKPSCDCMKAIVKRNSLPAGDSVRLEVVGEQQGHGPFAYDVAIMTDHPDRPLLKIPVRGYVERPILVDPPGLIFDRVSADATAHREASLVLTEGVDAQSAVIEVPEGTPLSAKLVCAKDSDLPKLVVGWHGSPKPGWHRHHIRLGVKNLPRELFSTLHVAVNVVPAVSISPRLIWIQEPELALDWKRVVAIKSARHVSARLSTRWSEDGIDSLVASTVTKGSAANELLLVLSGKAESNGRLHGRYVELIVERAGRGPELGRIQLYFGTPLQAASTNTSRFKGPVPARKPLRPKAGQHRCDK